MDCNIIKDLLPLYLDECCSEESKELVEKHINECDSCKKALCNMQSSVKCIEPPTADKKKNKKISLWVASIMQSVLMFLSFFVITIGVAYEDFNPDANGFVAFVIVVPATGFMLSLANWHFIPLYKNKKTFVICSVIITAILILIAGMITSIILESSAIEYFSILGLFITNVYFFLPTLLCLLASTFFAFLYADLVGKE